MLQPYLDRIIEEFTTGESYAEVFRAKKEYFKKAGEVFEDDPEFEQRMCVFMDWYLFDRDLPGIDLPPVKYFFRKKKDTLNSDELTVYRDLCSTIHSIFKHKRFLWFGRGAVIQDLFSGKKYVVNDPKVNNGFSRGDVFEARLTPFKGRFEFSQGFCFHPREIRSFIVNEINKIRFQDKSKHSKLILQLSSMKLKYSRFQQMGVKFSYQFQNGI